MNLKNKKIYILIFLLIIDGYNILVNIFFYLNIYIIKKLNRNILVEIDFSNYSLGGPGNFLKGIYKVLPFSSNNCSFIPFSYINFIFKPDYFHVPYPKLKEKYFEKLVKSKKISKYILGPVFLPNKWNSFPNPKDWKEKSIAEILNITKGIAVHSKRVRDYLAQRSYTMNNLKKYKIIRPCTYMKPKKVKSFSNRKIDILFFVKFADVNRSKQGEELLSLLKKTSKKIVKIEYGYYTKRIIKKIANDSKFIIYFSFFDTGAIGLKEIQNYGVFTFTLQKDLAIDNETSFFIPELMNINNMKLAFYKIINIIESISLQNPNSQLIAKKNQMINSCENSLIDLCENL